MAPSARVVEISATDALPLRRAVLRCDTPSHVASFPGDDDPTTTHLGVRVGDDLVAISMWLRDDTTPAGSATATSQGHRIRLRGMATLAAFRGQGFGRLLVAEGLRRAQEKGAVEVWANARDSSLTFYQEQGFEVVGDGFVTSDTGLPHHVVRHRLWCHRCRPRSQVSPSVPGLIA